MLGDTFDRALWIDACHRAGVPATASPTCDELRRIASELTEIPGPAARIGQALQRHIAEYEYARNAQAA